MKLKCALRALTIAILIVGAFRVSGRAAGSFGFGPNLVTHTDITVSSGATVVFTPTNQDQTGATMCVLVQNTGGTNNARCGDSNVGAARGYLLVGSAYASITLCTPGTPLYCYPVSSSTTIGATEVTR